MKNSIATESLITETLRDSGCDDSEVQMILTHYRNNEWADMEKMIRVCRSRQLENLHFSQQCIDRLDYLSYRLDKHLI